MKNLPLEKLHIYLGARMAEYAGWNMPVQYSSAVKEVRAVRERAGLFDISHMGRLKVTGSGALETLRNLSTNDTALLNDGVGQYTLFLNQNGGVIDDTIVYRQNAESFFVVVNAVNLEKDKEWIASHLLQYAELTDQSDSTVFFALQGPLAGEIIANTGASAAASLKRFGFTQLMIGDIPCDVFRTGYTGEDGFEIVTQNQYGEALVQLLMEVGGDDLDLCGLAARDVLRIEAGFTLYGHEIDEDINPIEAGLMRFVKLDNHNFEGKNALETAISAPQTRALIGLEMVDRTVPRSSDQIFAQGEQIGYVTSGTFSPTLSKGIALAFVEPKYASEGQEIELRRREDKHSGLLKKLPLYRRRTTHAK